MTRWLSIALLLFVLPSCGSDDADPDVAMDVASETSDATTCVCDGGCPTNMCDVRVVLESSCAGKVETATVSIDGQVVGTATLDAPFVSCEAWPCDTMLTLQVDGDNFTTGPRLLPAVLDPDVPLGCENL